MQWLSWETSGDELYRAAAESHAADFSRRVRDGVDLDTHDLGFLFSLASITTSRMGSDQAVRDDARDAALLAADHLMARFLEPAGIIQAWGDLRDPAQAGRTIIDSLMNMPLLSWAAAQTGDERYADAVRRHTAQLRTHILRPDDTTFHTFYWDVESGRPLRGATEQGAFDDSCWTRGQAWGIYGFAINSRATGDPGLREAAWRCARYFLSHLPSDDVPYWDLAYQDGSDAPRDSSSAAIAACGLLELAGVEPDPERAAAATAGARRLVSALVARCAPQDPSDSDALLLHGVYDLPKNVGVDEGNALGRLLLPRGARAPRRPGMGDLLVRLLTIRTPEGERAGVAVDIDGTDRAAVVPGNYTTVDVLSDPDARAAARQAVSAVTAASPALAELELAVPVRPGKILCLGYNYRGHVPDGHDPRADDPDYPDVFVKTPNALGGPGDPVVLPAVADDVDYEGEIAIVIGATARSVPVQDALSYVGGFTLLNDVSDRTWQRRQSQWTMGKCFDGFAPLGPWIVTSDDVPDPQDLLVEVVRDGQVTVSQSTATTIFSVAFIVHHLSTVMTLEPGDVISTGTPQKLPAAQESHRPLAPGDAVTVRVTGIGELTTHFIAPQEVDR